jgi:Beta-propeller repeat
MTASSNRLKITFAPTVSVVILAVVLVGPTSSTPPDHSASRNRHITAQMPGKPAVIAEFARRAPILSFEANRGQLDARAAFVARGSDASVFLTSSEMVIAQRCTRNVAMRPGSTQALRMPAERPCVHVLRTTLLGADPAARLSGTAELTSKANYLIGDDPEKWHVNVPTYAKVEQRNVYPEIDLIYYGSHGRLEYDFIVKPGADPRQIRMRFDGAERIDLNPAGELVIHIGETTIHQRRPVIYQNVDGVRREVAGGYVFAGEREIGFQLAAYDSDRALVIDPVFFFSTYLGGSSLDAAYSVAIDAAGNAYLTGQVLSTDFPTVTGAFQPTSGGGSDAFVTKLNPTGSGLIYSTYLGGSGADVGRGIAVDGAGNAYVTGSTTSTNFPVTANAFKSASGAGGTTEAFIARLNATGSALVYSSALVGVADASTRFGTAIVTDALGNAYAVGLTQSRNLPTTPGVFQPNHGNSGEPFQNGPPDLDAFIAKFNTNGSGTSSLVYCSYLGGQAQDDAADIALDTQGNAYVVGETFSANFPTTPGALQTSLRGPMDGFVTKVNPTASALVYSTYLGGSTIGGGSGTDHASGIALDSLGNAYVTGFTGSTDFPITAGAYQTSLLGSQGDAFVTKLNAAGTGLVYSTFLGDASSGVSIATDVSGNAYVAGSASSGTFPVTPGAPQPSFGGGNVDGFVAKFNTTGSALVYSTYLGGMGNDFVLRMALDGLPTPNVYVTGYTDSINFPTTSGALQTAFAGGSSDAFLTKITEVVLPPPSSVGKVSGGGAIDVSGGIATFGFVVQRDSADGSIKGKLDYVNHQSGTKLQATAYTTFTISNNTASIGGNCTNNDGPCTFMVNVADNGEPGTNDVFSISVSGGPTEGGTLRSGNVQIR